MKDLISSIECRDGARPPSLSIVIPVCNEADNIEPLAREICAVFGTSVPFEVIFVDDGSTDETAANVRRVRDACVPQVRLLRHSMRRGQSAALHTGVSAARADWVATLDGDGQNDPADIPKLLAQVQAPASGDRPLLVMGHRQARKDTWVRRVSSRIANSVRKRMLHDATPDTGCGIKVMHRKTFLQLPTFNHMHRFLPALYLRSGAKVVSIPVNHRPRTRGQSKYGINDRLWVGLIDLFGVRWLIRRAPPRASVTEE